MVVRRGRFTKGRRKRIGQRLGFNLGIPSSAEWSDPLQTRTLDSFYTADGASGVISASTGWPVSGDNKLTIQVRGGVKWADGNYTATWTGAGTVGGDSSPKTIVVSGQDTVDYAVVGEVSNFAIVPEGGATGTYNSTFSARAQKANCIRFMEAWRLNEDINSGAIYDPVNPYIRQRIVTGANTFWHPSITPTMIGNIGVDFNTDLWVNFHHRATDTNITDAIAAIRATGYDRTLRVEFSNEPWNFAFPQHNILNTWALASGQYDTAPGQTSRVAAYAADRADQLGELAKGVDSNIKVMLNVWTGVPNTFLNAQNYATRWPLQYVDALTTSWYFGGPPSRQAEESEMETLTASEAETLCRDDWTTRVIPLLQTWHSYADGQGWDHEFYEGGPALERVPADGATANLSALCDSAEVANVVGEALDWIDTNIGGLALLFETPGDPGKAWSWHNGELGADTPRYDEFLSRVA